MKGGGNGFETVLGRINGDGKSELKVVTSGQCHEKDVVWPKEGLQSKDEEVKSTKTVSKKYPV